jgi:oligoendopeptidase F
VTSVNGRYQQSGWTLTALLPAPAGSAVDQAIADLEAATAAIEALRPTLSPDMDGEDFLQALQAVETFAQVGARLGSYGQLWFTENTQNQAALAFMGRMEQLLTEAQNRILFINLWWKGLEDEEAERLLAYAGDNRYYLEQERLFKDHTLTETEEKIINVKDVNGINAIVTLYDMITSKFVYELEVDGEKKQLTRDQLMTYVRDPSPELREAAYQEQFRVYQQDASLRFSYCSS